jgi:PD-(D/E)XK nuclease superfamily
MVGQENRIGSVGDVFSVTRRSGFEVTTHSALLCDLLDPRGSHGQGGAFLKAFLEIVDGNLPPDVVGSAWPPADGWWRVTAECRTEEGRLDIILANRGPSGPATIAIENKWNAGLGNQQLERYGEYLTKLRRSEQSHRTCLVYLTRDGENYGTPSLADVICLSYSVHILRLIQSVLEASKVNVLPALREPLLQYCAVLSEDDA